jgi:hypothetical protein
MDEEQIKEEMIDAEEEEANEEKPFPWSAENLDSQDFPSPHSAPELCEVLSERYVLQLSPEDDALLDPLERTVRYLIPIPKYYYWDVLRQASNENPESFSIADVPWSVRLWHDAIGSADYTGAWLNQRLAQPIASWMGLTGPRFHEVLNSMTEEELQQSRNRILERKRRDAYNRSNI